MKFENPTALTQNTPETTIEVGSKDGISTMEGSIDNIDHKKTLDVLNKVRQSNSEYDDIYNLVINGKSTTSKFSNLLSHRPDLAEKFAVGKNGEPYKSTREASHDLVEFLANEAETNVYGDERAKADKSATEAENLRLAELKGKIDAQKDFLELLNKARQGNNEHEDVYWHVFNGKSASGTKYPESIVKRPDLLDKFSVGKNGELYRSTREASHDLVDFLANEAEAELKRLTNREKAINSKEDNILEGEFEMIDENQNKIEGGEKPNSGLLEQAPEEKNESDPNPNPEPTPEPVLEPKPSPEPPPVVKQENLPNQEPEQDKEFEPISKSEKISLEDARDAYLKAKRLRGNVFRGIIMGSPFKRKLKFEGEDMKFGGKKGKEDLESVRNAYQEGLKEYRKTELYNFAVSLNEKVTNGEVDINDADYEIKKKMIELLNEEQRNIDERAVEGIEQNVFEKMKTKWRQHTKGRLVAGLLLGGAAMTGVGGAAVVGARAGMGAVGTYVGVESGLEKYSKLIGHKGLVDKIEKQGNFISDEGLARHIRGISNEDIKKEAARLRMLQVEKGISMSNKKTGKEMIAAMILERDNELTALDAFNTGMERNESLYDKLAEQVNAKNELVESEVDKERLKKMARKTTALLAGVGVGWLIGGKLFEDPKVELPQPPSAPGVPEIPKITPHTVTSGENVWKIIESDLDSKKMMAGMGEGERTFVIDALKDKFEAMSPADLKKLGFSSGDPDLIYVGEKLDMSGVLNPKQITEALLESKKLTPQEISQIINNNTTIANWFAKHHHELKGVFDSAIIEKILKGSI